jgi:ABC-type sugar transport system ATPase subunit
LIGVFVRRRSPSVVRTSPDLTLDLLPHPQISPPVVWSERGFTYTGMWVNVRMTRVEIEGLTKRFRDVVAVDHLTAHVASGEFLAVVGPTGCGKTTLLRLIAGLLRPDEGVIRFDGEPINDLAPAQRRVRMVFQDYALYPHLRVFKENGYSNLGFPLNIRRIKRDRVRSIVEALSARLGIEKRLFPRRPRELSAGQQQRVAVGRALALPPKVLLLDEPLSNLDTISRATARKELRAFHEQEKITTLYVTHNLTEAFAMADRIAVMDHGRLVQQGTPRAIKSNPATALVRSLVESEAGSHAR